MRHQSNGLLWACLGLLLSANLHAQAPLRRFLQSPAEVNRLPYGANAAAGKYVLAGDARIYYEVYGSGQPIVLLHGGVLGSTIELAAFIDELQKTYQVIAVSSRGHGKSAIGTQPVSYEQKAEDVMAVVNAVTRDSFMMLGFSDGAYTAYKVASMYPERVKKLVAIGAGEQIPGLRRVKFDLAELARLDSAYWQQQLSLMPEPEKLPAFLASLEDFYNSVVVSKALFSSIRCPVLLVAGELDRNAPLSTIISAYQMIPNSQLAIIPNAGHVVFSENFAAVWACVRPFLSPPQVPLLSLTPAMLEPVQVSGSLTTINGLQVVRVVKDTTVVAVDEPTFVKLAGVDFQDGEIELKVMSRLLPTAPDYARGFIGLAFRIDTTNTSFESIYIRPANGRAQQQVRRNHAIQYFSYPDYKFDRLRRESPEMYEAYADMGLNEWISMKIVVQGSRASLFLQGHEYPSLIVHDLKLGQERSGGIGLWVDVGTEGFFRDIAIRPYKH